MSNLCLDVNCVIGTWPDGGPTFYDAEDLLKAMARLGITHALVRHSLGWQHHPAEGNALLMEQLSGQGSLVPCWAALPLITGEMGALQNWLAQLAEAKVRAICLYPMTHGYPLTTWQCDALLAPLAERHYLLLLERAEASWEQIAWLCSQYTDLRVLLLNCGYRVLRPLYALLDAYPNLYLDLSTIANFRGIEDLTARFGAERLLFGTGQPRNEGAGIVTALNYSALDEPQREAIWGGNLARLLQEVQL